MTNHDRIRNRWNKASKRRWKGSLIAEPEVNFWFRAWNKALINSVDQRWRAFMELTGDTKS